MIVLDTSALLALIFNEPGSKTVEQSLSDARLSAVSLSEAISKLIDRGFTLDQARATITKLPLAIVAFDTELALIAASFRPATKRLGFSFADRACLALARHSGATALTADRAWGDVDLGVVVTIVR
ncbi:PIN domain-containing protein [Jiella endophytica]|uniref:PIN domain-containing protein n=1 Tax=Jiella endophytica TaxID=2558362 RepID=A0A4Y8RJI4_9HYPH|nr:PIN domain-containing protein [Jiella endophytica]